MTGDLCLMNKFMLKVWIYYSSVIRSGTKYKGIRVYFTPCRIPSNMGNMFILLE